MAISIGFHLSDFERNVYTRKFTDAKSQLFHMLFYHDFHRSLGDAAYSGPDGTDVQVEGLAPLNQPGTYLTRLEVYNRLAAAITALLCDRDLTLTPAECAMLLSYKSGLRRIFGCSSFGHMDHILINAGICDEALNLLRTDDDAIQKLLVCISLDGDLQINLAKTASITPQLTMYAVLGLLHGADQTFSNLSEAKVDHLLDACDSLIDVKPDEFMVDRFPSPWMQCSYFSSPRRHQLKKLLNHLIGNWQQQFLNPSVAEAMNQAFIAREKPRMLVLLERYRSLHAVYRSFHAYIERFGQDFELVALVDAGNIDETAAQDFSSIEYIKVDSAEELNSIVHQVNGLSPDVIFYPSVGMAAWTILLANLRLAPIQIAAAGHPASTFSEHMDYFFIGGTLGKQNNISPSAPNRC